jgi:pyrroloquinoline quinone biosynthesis protein D
VSTQALDPTTPWPAPDERPRLEPQWQVRLGAGDEPVLWGTGGEISLNATAAEILRRCDGQHSIASLVAELESSFDAEGITDDVNAFLRIARSRGWVR